MQGWKVMLDPVTRFIVVFVIIMSRYYIRQVLENQVRILDRLNRINENLYQINQNNGKNDKF